jgi:hypothetical protein
MSTLQHESIERTLLLIENSDSADAVNVPILSHYLRVLLRENEILHQENEMILRKVESDLKVFGLPVTATLISRLGPQIYMDANDAL